MIFTTLHKSAINNAIRQGLSFAMFRDKGSEELRFICDDNSKAPLLSDVKFFAVDWLEKYSERVEIEDKLTLEQAAAYKSAEPYKLQEPWCESTERDGYLASITALVKELKKTGGKTVVSRAISCNVSSDIAYLTEQYFRVNKAAYCCVLHTPKTGCWLIASPELLLSVNKQMKTAETVALAGTRKISTEGRLPQPWDAKNTAEQRIVRDFIAQIFSDLQFEFKVLDDVTVQTNNIEHLATYVTAKIESESDIERIVDELSPTPALCGMPRELSIERINDIEQHPRRLYGGYFGFVDKQRYKAIVTLRCAQLSETKACIYAGGGITADSDAEAEWTETEMKSQVLANVLKKK